VLALVCRTVWPTSTRSVSLSYFCLNIWKSKVAFPCFMFLIFYSAAGLDWLQPTGLMLSDSHQLMAICRGVNKGCQHLFSVVLPLQLFVTNASLSDRLIHVRSLAHNGLIITQCDASVVYISNSSSLLFLILTSWTDGFPGIFWHLGKNHEFHWLQLSKFYSLSFLWL